MLNRDTYFLLAIALSGVVFCVGRANASDKQSDELLPVEPGVIAQVAEHTAKLLPLHIVDGKLKLDRKTWAKTAEKLSKDDKKNPQGGPVVIRGGGGIQIQARMIVAGRDAQTPPEKLFEKIQQTAGGGSMRSTRSNETYQRTFLGQTAHGSLNMDGGAFYFHLSEVQSPGRVLELRDEEKEGMLLRFLLPDGDFLQLSQAGDGAFTCIVSRGGKVQRLAGESFGAFYAANRDYVDNKLFPLLSRIGITAPITAMNPEVRRAVIAALRPMDPQTMQRGRKLIEDLDADDFETREKATEALTKEYQQFKSLIQAKHAEEGLSVEAKERLQRIVNEASSKGARVDEVVRAMKLTDDATYLTELLKMTEDESAREVIEARIAALKASPKKQ